MAMNLSVENAKKRLIHFPPSALIKRNAYGAGNVLKVRSVVLIKISIVSIMLKYSKRSKRERIKIHKTITYGYLINLSLRDDFPYWPSC
jgi:hypothetical protein